MSQTTYTETLAIGRKGQLADASPKVADSFVAEGNLTMGLLVQRGTLADQVQPIAVLGAADDDSLVATPVATQAAAFVVSLAEFDGVIGHGLIAPAQLVTLTLNSHADWLATVATVVGTGPGGGLHTEQYAIPAGGNVVLTGVTPFANVDYVSFEAQTGTNGTVYVGTDPATVALGSESFPGIVAYDPGVESYSAAAEIEDEKPVSVISRGRVLVEVEGATLAGGPVYVRMVESGSDLRGQFSGEPTANFYKLAGAKFLTVAAASGLAVMDIRG